MAIEGFDGGARERLSALADGEIDPTDLAASCNAWREDGETRLDWHAWHLIGDVLRSDDLASDPRHDRRFCASVRMRLDTEPVVFAPAGAVTVAARQRPDRGARSARWPMAGAVAAGVVLVVGTFFVVRPGQWPASAQIADASAPGGPAVPTLAAAPAPEAEAPPVAIVADSKVIRDARLERYLEAHKQFAGTSALGVPSAFLRSATVDSAAR